MESWIKAASVLADPSANRRRKLQALTQLRTVAVSGTPQAIRIVRQLRHTLETERSSIIRQHIIETARMVPRITTYGLLRAAAMNDPSPTVRQTALEAQRQMRDVLRDNLAARSQTGRTLSYH